MEGKSHLALPAVVNAITEAESTDEQVAVHPCLLLQGTAMVGVETRLDELVVEPVLVEPLLRGHAAPPALALCPPPRTAGVVAAVQDGLEGDQGGEGLAGAGAVRGAGTQSPARGRP